MKKQSKSFLAFLGILALVLLLVAFVNSREPRPGADLTVEQLLEADRGSRGEAFRPN